MTDEVIQERWVELALQKPWIQTRTTKGLNITVVRIPVSTATKVEYKAYLNTPKNISLLKRGGFKKLVEKGNKVAWLYPGPLGLWDQGIVPITNAIVEPQKGVDIRRQGVGTVLYNLIEQDIQSLGARGIEPQWGSMSNNAIGFWRERLRRRNHSTLVDRIDNIGWNKMSIQDIRDVHKILFPMKS